MSERLPRTRTWQVRDWRWLWLRKRTESHTWTDEEYAYLTQLAIDMANEYREITLDDAVDRLRSIHPPR